MVAALNFFSERESVRSHRGVAPVILLQILSAGHQWSGRDDIVTVAAEQADMSLLLGQYARNSPVDVAWPRASHVKSIADSLSPPVSAYCCRVRFAVKGNWRASCFDAEWENAVSTAEATRATDRAVDTEQESAR